MGMDMLTGVIRATVVLSSVLLSVGDNHAILEDRKDRSRAKHRLLTLIDAVYILRAMLLVENSFRSSKLYTDASRRF
ncbi:hypothetical protein N7540_009266 [Penicillium herquei]|nr:hypothetical protein N7540_009266 [Penicillium herquei]